MIACHRCETPIVMEATPGRRETCPSCHAYLHACKNCRFYDQAAHNHCREPQAEWVPDAEGGNFCGFFVFKEWTGSGSADAATTARAKLEAAFGGRAAPKEDPKARLERLFGQKKNT